MSARRVAAALGVAALLVAALLVAAPVAAYVRTTTERGAALRWRTDCIGLVAHIGTPPPNLSSEVFLAAARAAAQTWSRHKVSCTSLELTIDPVETAETKVSNDKQNNLMFRRRAWCKDPRDPAEPCYDDAALAITTVYAQQSDGTILDGEVEVNAVNFAWADLVGGQGVKGNVQDIQNTLTHEFGHLIGLDHNCYVGGSRARPVDHLARAVPDCSGASTEVREATMYAAVVKGDIKRRDLTEDDVQALCAVYPAGSSSCGTHPELPSDRGGCALARRRPAPGGLALGLAVALGLMAWRRRRG